MKKIEYIDLGLPSGTLWANRNVNVGKIRHFTYMEARMLSMESEFQSGSLPTYDDFQELIQYCSWKWTMLFGKLNGYRVVGPNGNSIFLPASGYCSGTSLLDPGFYGRYWSTNFDGSSLAFYLYFSSSSKDMYRYSRTCSLSVRTVKHVIKHK